MKFFLLYFAYYSYDICTTIHFESFNNKPTITGHNVNKCR